MQCARKQQQTIAKGFLADFAVSASLGVPASPPFRTDTKSASAPPSWVIQEFLTPSPGRTLEVQTSRNYNSYNNYIIFPAVGEVPLVSVLLWGEFPGKIKNILVVVNQAGAWAADGGRRRQQQRGADTEHSAADLCWSLLQDVLLLPVAPGHGREMRIPDDLTPVFFQGSFMPAQAFCGISQPHHLDTGLLCLTSCSADIVTHQAGKIISEHLKLAFLHIRSQPGRFQSGF